MRFSLSHEDAKNYISGIDFSNLTPSDKSYSVGIDDDISGGAVILTSADFSHQVRLDKKNGIAVYSENGSLYYYTITAEFYSSVYARTADSAKYDFNGNPNEENPDVVTG